MKVQITRNSLYSAVVNMGLAINPKPALEVMSNIKFSDNGNELILQSTDSEVHLKMFLPCIEVSDGSMEFCVDASRIKNALANIPEQPIVITVNETELKCKYKGGSFKLPLDSAKPSCFPMFPEAGEVSTSVSAKAELMSRIIREGVSFTSVDPLRPVLCGMCFNISPEGTDIVATNGYCMMLTKIRVKSDKKETFVISRNGLNVVSKLFAKENGNMEISSSGNNVFIECGNVMMSCRKVDGRFVNYNSVIPSNPNIIAEYEKADMVSAIKRVSVMANDEGQIVLDVSEGKVTVSSENIDFSTSAQEEVSAKCDGNLRVGYKADVLQNVLSLLSGTAKMQLISNAAPCLFREKREYCEITAIAMPIMIN